MLTIGSKTFFPEIKLLDLDVQVFSVIPAEAGIQKVSVGAWIPGLRSAAPGMTVIGKYCLKKT
jgi:hypothetical protein